MIFLPAKKGYLPDFVIAYSEMNRSVLRSILDAPDFPAAATTQVRIFWCTYPSTFSIFVLKSFLTSSPQDKIPFMQALAMCSFFRCGGFNLTTSFPNNGEVVTFRSLLVLLVCLLGWRRL